jgi:hypothetical protein
MKSSTNPNPAKARLCRADVNDQSKRHASNGRQMGTRATRGCPVFSLEIAQHFER